MQKNYNPNLNMWALDTDADHILHRKGSDDYTAIRRATVTNPDEWEEVAVADMRPYSDEQYNAKVSELIHQRYNADKETSLINNMLEDNPTEEHISEYREYQAFRAECKLRAKDLELYIV